MVNGSTGRYVPDGVDVVGSPHGHASLMAQDEAVMTAAADDWCADTVRLQVRQANFVSTDGHVDQAFLAAVTTEVRFAEARGLVVVLNLQWQLDDASLVESMPNHRSEAFWGSSPPTSGKTPTSCSTSATSRSSTLRAAGCSGTTAVCATVRQYLGIQALADYNRARASNLFWIEGIGAGATLSGAWRYHSPATGPSNSSEHRPPGPRSRHVGLSVRLDRQQRTCPGTDGEWADYARTRAPWACWDDAPVSAPWFLNYLAGPTGSASS